MYTYSLLRSLLLYLHILGAFMRIVLTPAVLAD